MTLRAYGPTAESLRDLDVVLIAEGSWLDPHRATKILRHAGARVHLVHDEGQALRMAAWLGARCLVIRDSAGQVAQIAPGFKAMPDVQHLVLMRGRRRVPWTLEPGVVAVDVDFLHASFFVHAVAVAAGRASSGLPQAGVVERRASMVAWMGRVGLVGMSSLILAGCALPSAMPAPPPSPHRVTFSATPRTTIAGFRYEAREDTAAGQVAGRLIDDATGMPIARAGAAWLTERPDSVTADQWGRFGMHDVGPGRYTLVSYAEGFEPRIDRLEVTGNVGVAVEVRLKRAKPGSMLGPMPGPGSAVRVVAAAGSGAQ